MNTTASVALANREQLHELLDELNERGLGEAVVIDSSGRPHLLAAYEDGGLEAAVWDAFGSHPYGTEGEPDGLARQLDIEESVADGRLALEGRGFGEDAIVLAVSEAVEHPGLTALRFPLTVIHEDRA
jgi:hypothetical protein